MAQEFRCDGNIHRNIGGEFLIKILLPADVKRNELFQSFLIEFLYYFINIIIKMAIKIQLWYFRLFVTYFIGLCLNKNNKYATTEIYI